MKWTILASVVASLFLSGCVSAPNIDYSKIDYDCAQKCNQNHSTCMSGFKLFPAVAEKQCKDEVEMCANSCPQKGSSIPTAPLATTSDKASVTDRLKELDALHKSGAINDSEYSVKKQEILKSL
jgi:hypothetical protein